MILGPVADEGGSPEVDPVLFFAFRQDSRGLVLSALWKFPEVKEEPSSRSVVKGSPG